MKVMYYVVGPSLPLALNALNALNSLYLVVILPVILVVAERALLPQGSRR